MKEFRKSYALVIGINNYQNAAIPVLRNAARDAQAVAEVLESEQNFEVITCLDERACYDDLKQLLTETLPAQVTGNDRLLVYFAGHGVAVESEDGPAGYILPCDAGLSSEDKFLHMADLQQWLSKLDCRHLLLVLDCCFAGAFRWSAGRHVFVIPKVIHQERYTRFVKDPAWQVLTSAAFDQQAADARENSQFSPFAHALIEGLKGAADIFPGPPARDGVITATELYLYLREQVETLPGSRQTPGLWHLKKHDKGEFIFLSPKQEPQLPPAPALNEASNPYRGLNSYEEQDKDLFFGRQRIEKTLLGKVLKNPLTVVVGASGAGKSSVVKAGLVPRVREFFDERWHILPVFRPGRTPLKSIENLSAELGAPNLPFVEAVGGWCKKNPGSTLLLVIDQLEELVTMCRNLDERRKFLQSIAELLNGAHDRLRVVITVRSDFEPQFLKSALEDRWVAARYVIPPMTQDELREAIEEPASAKVLYFKPATLVNELINEVVQMPGALPLLSFTLSEMYLKYLERRSDDRALTEEDYASLGGVIGSLRQRAEQEYESSNDAEKRTMRRVMLRMVALEGGEIARRRVPQTEFAYTDEAETKRAEAVIERLIAARLLVNDKDAEENRIIEPAHDALVRGWDMLLQWIHEEQREQDNLLLQRRVTQAATDWEKGTGKFWDNDSRLPQLTKILKDNVFWFNQEETEFILNSVNEGRKKRRRRNIFVSGAGILLTTLALVAVAFGIQANNNAAEAETQRKSAEDNRVIAEAQRVLADNNAAEAKRQQKLAEDNEDEAKKQKNIAVENEDRAKKSAAEAKKQQGFAEENAAEAKKQQGIAETNAAEAKRQEGIAIAKAEESRQRLIDFYEEQGRRESVSRDPERALMYLSEAYREGGRSEPLRLMLADVSQKFNGQLSTLTGHNQNVTDVKFSGDGQRVITASADQTAIVWDVATGKQISRLKAKQRIVRKAFLNRDGTRAITVAQSVVPDAENVIVKYWDVDKGSEIKDFSGEFADIAFSADGRYLFRSDYSNGALVYDAADAKELFKLDGYKEELNVQLIARDEKSDRFISASRNLVIVHNNTGGISSSITPQEAPERVFFSPAGPRYITLDANRQRKLWDAETGNLLRSLKHPSADAVELNISPDGERIATSSNLHVMLWNAENGAPLGSSDLSQFKGSSPTYSPDLKHLFTFKDSKVEIRELLSGKLESTFGFTGGEPARLALSADGDDIFMLDSDNIGRLWAWRNRQESTPVNMQRDGGAKSYNVSAAFSADGNRILTKSSFSRRDEALAEMFDAGSGRRIAFSPAEPSEKILDISPDARRTFRVAGESGYIVDQNDAAAKVVLKDFRGQVEKSLFSPDGNKLAVKFDNLGIKLWDARTGEVLSSRTEKDYDGAEREPYLGLADFAFSRDGRQIVYTFVGDDEQSAMVAEVWKTDGGKAPISAPIPYYGTPREAPAVLVPNSDRLVTPAGDSRQTSSTPQVWDISNKKPKLLFSLEGHSQPVLSIAFSSDGKLILTVSDDGTAKVWNTDTGELQTSIKDDLPVVSAGFNSNDTLLVTAGKDSLIKIWNADTGALLSSLSRFSGKATFAAFSPAGQLRILTADEKEVVRIWELPMESRAPEDVSKMVERLIPYRFYKGRPLLATQKNVKVE